MDEPAYIWASPNAADRNEYVVFRHGFLLQGRPTQATLNLFADTRYRLIVNGEIVCHGPNRFKKGFPEYDVVDIAPYLHAGKNAIVVVVNNYGELTFISDPGAGGMIAWGEVIDGGRKISFASGPEWKALRAKAWWSGVPKLTFAIGPGECLDARLLPEGWDRPEFDDSSWETAVPVPHPECWGKLSPRSIPLLDESEGTAPVVISTFAAAIDEGELRRVSATFTEDQRGLGGLFTHVYSPEEQVVRISSDTGVVFINGEEQDGKADLHSYLHKVFAVSLRKGWNTFAAVNVVFGRVCEFLFGFEKGKGLKIQVDPLDASSGEYSIGKLENDWGQARNVVGKLTAAPSNWTRQKHGAVVHTPYLDRVWTRLTPLEDVSVPAAIKRARPDGSVAILFDFQKEVLGRVVLEMHASAGTEVDLLYTERLEGGEALVGYQATRMVERYITRDGAQKWQTMHPRGMRYLEVLVRGNLSEFTLDRISMTQVRYPADHVGKFECSDPVLDRIWTLCRDTEQICMEDVFMDCPWRERGLYAGDLLVQFQNNLAMFGDHQLMRRCVELFLQTQDESGFVAPCSHGLSNLRHIDYAAVIVQVLASYWDRTGDLPFLRSQKERLRKLVEALQGAEVPGLHLVDATNYAPYVDIGKFDKFGINGPVNCFQQRAFAEASRLFSVLGENDLAKRFQEHAALVKGAIRNAFLDPVTGLFMDRRAEDVETPEPSVQVNSLAALYDIAEPDEKRVILEFLIERCRNPFVVEPPEELTDCHCTTYFAFYTLGALYQNGMAAEAEETIRSWWTRLVDGGAWTTWEYLLPKCSLCHAWAAHPAHWLSTQVLGVQYSEAGNPDRIHIHPHPGSLGWAKGIFPHPRGPISVSWKRLNEHSVEVTYDAPAGVDLTVEGAKIVSSNKGSVVLHLPLVSQKSEVAA